MDRTPSRTKSKAREQQRADRSRVSEPRVQKPDLLARLLALTGAPRDQQRKQ